MATPQTGQPAGPDLRDGLERDAHPLHATRPSSARPSTAQPSTAKDHLNPLPQNVPDEYGLIGAVMVEPARLEEARAILAPEDFYDAQTRSIYKAVEAIVQQGGKPDESALRAELARRGAHFSDEAMGNISAAMSAPENAPLYARHIHELAVMRRSIDEMRTGQQKLLGYREGDQTAREILSEIATRATRALQALDSGSPSESMHLYAGQALRDISAAREGARATALSTGLRDLDDVLGGGLSPCDLVIIAGRPSMGKTAFAMNIVENISVAPVIRAMRTGCTLSGPRPGVMVFSMEMSGTQLAMRILSSMSRINAMRMRRGGVSEDEIENIYHQMNLLYEARINVCDKNSITIEEMLARAQVFANALNNDGDQMSLLVVDYMQLMGGTAHRRAGDNRSTELSEISRGLKGMAKQLGVPVVALSQLNRSVEMRQDKRPIMSDLRESGAIEQDADVILFVHREGYYARNDPGIQGRGEIIVGKQRNGPTDTVDVAFDGECMRFGNIGDDAPRRSSRNTNVPDFIGEDRLAPAAVASNYSDEPNF